MPFRPVANNSAFKRFTFDISTEEAIRYDQALMKLRETQPNIGRSAHLRSLVQQFIDNEKRQSRGKGK